MTLTSDSGRTTVTVMLGDEGEGEVEIVQDGHLFSRFAIPRELRGPDGEPRNKD